ncbi:MAG TPA: hypothetical protein VGI90_09920 [Steroidobacteraceae bacterium]|jgi:hypothetical protein
MIVYHVTHPSAADAIDTEGFRDGSGTYMTSTQLSGVFVSDVPLVIESGLEDPVVFAIDLAEIHLVGCGLLEEGKNYREWIVPAARINAAGRRRVEWPECLDDIEALRARNRAL